MTSRAQFQRTSSEPFHAFGYVAGISVLGFTFAIVPVVLLGSSAHPLVWLGILFCAILLTLGYATATIGFFVELLRSPHKLAILPISDEAQEEVVVVAIPFLCHPRDIECLKTSVLDHAAKNPDERLVFALLSDLPDADEKSVASDSAILEAFAVLGDQLSGLLDGQRSRAVLLHRERKWAEAQGRWMGEERKRGKLQDLNCLIVRGDRSSFSLIVGDWQALREARKVLVLDLDTRLKSSAIRDLLRVANHPANQALMEVGEDIIREGYGIIQSRIVTECPSTGATIYSWFFDDSGGRHNETLLANETRTGLHQSVFGESSFFGKGLYDVEVVDALLWDRLPRDSILSHDIVEGAFVRAGTTAATAMYEDAMSNHISALARRHRWTRGDWQNLIWLLPSTVDAAGARCSNKLSASSRLRIFENLRLALVPIALLVVIATALSSPGFGNLGLAFAVAHVFGLPTIGTIISFASKPPFLSAKDHLEVCAIGYLKFLGRGTLSIAFLPSDAVNSISACATSTARMFLTGRNMLDWTTSSASRERPKAIDFVRSLWAGPAIGTTLLLVVPTSSAEVLALPIVWVLSPIIGWWTARPNRYFNHASVANARQLAPATAIAAAVA